MKGPPSIGSVRKVISLFIKRTWGFNIPGTTDTHEFTTGYGGVPHMFQHVAGIDKIKGLVFERQGFQGCRNQGTAMTLEGFASFGIVFREKIDKMGGILMRAMSRSDIQHCFPVTVTKPATKINFGRNATISQRHELPFMRQCRMCSITWC